MSDEIVLASPSRCHQFNGDKGKDVAALEKRLRAMNATEPVTIRRPTDVLLNANGLVQKKYRFSSTGLSQLCSALAPGLAMAINDIAGLRKSEDSDTVYDPYKAIQIINALIKLRFRQRLRTHGLIIDRGSNRVEGLVGPRYKFFSNLELFQRCQQFAAELDPPAEFFAATVAGRRVILRYSDPHRLFAVDTPHGNREPFYRGWHFSNSEIGDCSVRAGMLIIRRWRGTASLLETGKVVHVRGGRFGPKFSRLLDTLQRHASRELEETDYAVQVTNLMEQHLGLGGSPVNHAKQVEKLAGKLAKGALFKKTAKQIIHQAIAQGSYRQDRIEINGMPYDMLHSTLTSAIANRSAYDLYNSLTHVAKSLQPEQQEAAEKLAYKILMERHRLT